MHAILISQELAAVNNAFAILNRQLINWNSLSKIERRQKAQKTK